MIFLHYATTHPIYTYAFYSPLTKQVVYRQDCIFLVTTFPMRAARALTGTSSSGDSMIPVRSPLCFPPDPDDELSFQRWQYGDALPDFTDTVTGVPLRISPHRLAKTLRLSLLHGHGNILIMLLLVLVPWFLFQPPHTFTTDDCASVPTDASLLPDDTNTVTHDLMPVPLPMDEGFLPDDNDPVAHDMTTVLPESPTIDYSTHDRDRDLSRGMGHHLRWPISVHPTKTAAPNLVPLSVPVSPLNTVRPMASPLASSPFPVERVPGPPSPPPSTRILRPRTLQLSSANEPTPPTSTKRRPVCQRWYYDPVTPISANPVALMATTFPVALTPPPAALAS
jgi:hypothetical protein